MLSASAQTYSRLGLGRFHPPLFNAIVSNVPGPPIPLYLAGARVTATYPMGPLIGNTALNLTVLSQSGDLDVGVIACPDLVDDVGAIAEGFVAGVADLRRGRGRGRSRSTMLGPRRPVRRRPPSRRPPPGAQPQGRRDDRDHQPPESRGGADPVASAVGRPAGSRRPWPDRPGAPIATSSGRSPVGPPPVRSPPCPEPRTSWARPWRAGTAKGVAGLPVPSVSPGLAAQVAIDETLLAVAAGPNRMPRRADYERVGAELAHARLLFETQGWLDDPASYHRTPPPLVDPAVDRGWALGQRYERLLFNSGWAPRPDEPGAERWAGYEPNRTAVAAILRHRGPPRPWVVAVHGFACGYPFMDFVGLHALRLHRELGLNVAMPVLPLHGPRKITRLSGEAMLSFDLVNTVHGLTQAVWDLRRLLTWIDAQDAPGVAVYGVSLGAYVAALLAGLDDGIDCRRGRHPGGGLPEAVPVSQPAPHPDAGDRARDPRRQRRDRPPGRVAARVRAPGAAGGPVHLRRARGPHGPAAAGPRALAALGRAGDLLVRGQPHGLPVVEGGRRVPRAVVDQRRLQPARRFRPGGRTVARATPTEEVESWTG